MTPRHAKYPPTDDSRAPRWLVTYDVFRCVLASKCLSVGADLRTVMLQAAKQCEADGWTVENDGSYGFFFCNLDGQRREVRMQTTDPSKPVPLNNTCARGTTRPEK
jgi:hypothetical protein